MAWPSVDFPHGVFMQKLAFFFNKNSQSCVTDITEQLYLLNDRKIDTTLCSNFYNHEEIVIFSKSNPNLDVYEKASVYELNEVDVAIFFISTLHDLILLINIARKTKKLIVSLSFEHYKNPVVHELVKDVDPKCNIYFLVNYKGRKSLISKKAVFERKHKLRISFGSSECKFSDFFFSRSLVPIFCIPPKTKSQSLEALNIEYFYRYITSNIGEGSIHSENYIKLVKSELPYSSTLKKIKKRIGSNLIANSFLEYLLYSKKEKYSHVKYLTHSIDYFEDDSFIDAHSLFDPVNSIGLMSQGIKYCEFSPFSSVLFNKLESLRINYLDQSRNLVSKNRKKNVVFIVGRLFPSSISDGSNSHYNVLKLFTSLINIYNELNECDFYNVKVMVTFEKSFFTPFGKKDIYSDEKKDMIIRNFIADNVIKDESDLILCQGDSKKDKILDACRILERECPLTTIFLGGTYDSKVARSVIFKNHPVCFLPTTSTVDNAYGKIDPHFDVIRSISNHHTSIIHSKGISFDRIKHFTKPMFKSLELNLTEWDWNDYISEKDDKFFLVTPLVGGRIRNWLLSLSSDEINDFYQVFLRCPELIWVPVGASKEKLNETLSDFFGFKRLLSNDRIVPISYTEHLASLIEKSQLLFIPTLGGATTVAAATSLNVASVVDIASDSNTIIPHEGCFSSMSDAFEKISYFYDRPLERHMLIKDSQANLEKRFDVKGISRDFIDFIQLSHNLAVGN